MGLGNQKRKGLLLDSTLCIGCGACYQACKEINRLPATAKDFLEDDLSDKTFTVVKKAGGRFVRKLCMHCEEPTCASVCPVKALVKTELGPVIYKEDRCIGCRYCMQACPFGIPRHEWNAVRPYVRKCSLCADRIAAGLPTACSKVCPTGATRFGDRDDLIEEARSRMARSPGKYLERIYGLEEVGGTSVLLLSDAPFEGLGYRSNLPKHPLPLLTMNVLEKLPGLVLVGGILLGGIWWITNRRMEIQEASFKRNADEDRDQARHPE